MLTLRLDIIVYYCEAVSQTIYWCFFFKSKVKGFIISIQRLACVEYPFCLNSLSTISYMDNLAYLIENNIKLGLF